MGILYDKTTGYWTSKTTDEHGKDKRVKLRKILPGEPRRPIPSDVLELAGPQNKLPSLNAEPATLPPATEATPLIPWLDRFLTRYRRDRRPSSVNRMEFLLNLLKRFAGERKILTLNEFTVEVMEDFVSWRYMQKDKRLKMTVSKATVVSELSVLSGVFNAAVQADRLDKNPVSKVIKAERVGLPKDKDRIPKYLDPKQVKDFLKNLDFMEANGGIERDYADLARLLLYSGIRLTACMNMRFDWITADFMVKVPIPMDKAKTGYDAVIVGPGREVIERRRAVLGGTGRVFPSINRRDSVQTRLRKLGITPHQLRHSFATAAVDSKIPIHIISDLLGHHDVKTTAIYAKIRDTTKLDMAKLIVFGEPSDN